MHWPMAQHALLPCCWTSPIRPLSLHALFHAGALAVACAADALGVMELQLASDFIAAGGSRVLPGTLPMRSALEQQSVAPSRQWDPDRVAVFH